MNKFAKKVIAGTLSAIMFLSPCTAFAANSEDYIKEVYISTAKEESKAKDYLTQNGYTVLDSNLNEGTGEKAVYLGYKTTKDSKEAITDLKIMDMNGGYSQANYEMLVQNEREAISGNIKDLRVLIDTFKKNYKAGAPLAQYAYKMLNEYKDEKMNASANLKCDEGKTDMLMGDYFISDSITDENLTMLMLQGSARILESMYQYLTLGIYAKDETSILEKFAEVDPDDDYSSKLDDVAKTIISCWDVMHDGLKKYEDSDVKLDDDEDVINAYLETLNDTQKLDYLKYGALYETLNELEYGSDSMLDFFMQEDVRTKDVYPLASVFSQAQAIGLPHVGLAEILTLNGNKEVSNESESFMDDLTENALSDKEAKIVNVYADVDQNLFNGNVALTSEALAYQNASGDTPWYKANVSKWIAVGSYVVTGAAVGVAAFTGVMYFIKSSKIAASVDRWKKYYDSSKSVYEAAKATMVKTESQLSSLRVFVNSSSQIQSEYNDLVAVFQTDYRKYTNALKIMDDNFNSYQAAMQKGSAAAWGWTAIAATGVALIAQGIYYGVKVYNYYHPDYLQIPQIICDENSMVNDDGEVSNTYTYYYAARQHIDGDKNNEYGEYADLNGFTGKQWNALYSTTDSKAGKPILASSLSVKVGNNKTEDKELPLSLFHTTASYNVNSHQYKDKKNGIFISFMVDENASSAASVFTTGKVALIAGISIAIGIVIGTACVVVTNKKSKKITAIN